MTHTSPARSVDPSGLPPLLQLFLVLVLVVVVGRRAKLSGGIRLAPPAFVPLATGAAFRFAQEFGTACAELVDSERRDEET